MKCQFPNCEREAVREITYRSASARLSKATIRGCWTHAQRDPFGDSYIIKIVDLKGDRP